MHQSIIEQEFSDFFQIKKHFITPIEVSKDLFLHILQHLVVVQNEEPIQEVLMKELNPIFKLIFPIVKFLLSQLNSYLHIYIYSFPKVHLLQIFRHYALLFRVRYIFKITHIHLNPINSSSLLPSKNQMALHYHKNVLYTLSDTLLYSFLKKFTI